MVNPDSNPTLSLSVYMFFGPALLWIGATLLLVRLRGRFMAALARRAARRPDSLWPPCVVSSLGRRAAAINRGLVVIGLLLAFARQPRRLHGHLRPAGEGRRAAHAGGRRHGHRPAGRRRLAATCRPRSPRSPASAATTAVDHSYAYVGPDLQDTFGIDPATLPQRDHACATPTSSAGAPTR